MTETEWLACEDVRRMFDLLKDGMSERKVLLAALHACRSSWKVLPLSSLWTVLIICERYSEGRSSLTEIIRLVEVFTNRLDSIRSCFADLSNPAHLAKSEYFYRVVLLIDHIADRAFGRGSDIGFTARCIFSEIDVELSHTIRDIFGNPFRPVTFSPLWRTSTAIALAAQMYESRDFSAMPILADALQDAGCDSADILNHCRGSGPHVRGCWVVDLVLAKE